MKFLRNDLKFNYCRFFVQTTIFAEYNWCGLFFTDKVPLGGSPDEALLLRPPPGWRFTDRPSKDISLQTQLQPMTAARVEVGQPKSTLLPLNNLSFHHLSRLNIIPVTSYFIFYVTSTCAYLWVRSIHTPANIRETRPHSVDVNPIIPVMWNECDILKFLSFLPRNAKHSCLVWYLSIQYLGALILYMASAIDARFCYWYDTISAKKEPVFCMIPDFLSLIVEHSYSRGACKKDVIPKFHTPSPSP